MPQLIAVSLSATSADHTADVATACWFLIGWSLSASTNYSLTAPSADHTASVATTGRLQVGRLLPHIGQPPHSLLLHDLTQLELRPGRVELALEHLLWVQVLLVEQKVEGIRADRLLGRHRAGEKVIFVVVVGAVTFGRHLTVARPLPVLGRDVSARVKNGKNILWF